jgi:hypothetical protein
MSTGLAVSTASAILAATIVAKHAIKQASISPPRHRQDDP